MKKYLFLLVLVLGSWSMSYAQRIILWSQDFDGTAAPSQWWEYVNNIDAFGEIPQPITGTNQWTINNLYDGQGLYKNTTDQSNTGEGNIAGAPESRYLHIADITSPAQNANWNPATASNRFCILESGICTRGMKNIEVTFYWIGEGSSSAYGEFYYTYNGNPWMKATTQSGRSQFNNSGQTWRFETVSLPDCADKDDISIGFRWNNDVNPPGTNTISFGVDDIFLTAETEDVNVTVTVPDQPAPCRGGTVIVCFKQSRILCPGIYILEMGEVPDIGNTVYNLGSVAYIFNEATQQALIAQPDGLCLNLPVPSSLSLDGCFSWRIRRVAIWETGLGNFPNIPANPGASGYLTPPTFVSPGSEVCFSVVDCDEEIWTQGYSATPPPTFSKQGNCDVVCVNSLIPSVTFNSRYVFNSDNIYIAELIEVNGTDTTVAAVIGSSADENAYPSPTQPGSIGGIVPDVPDGCNYYLRVRSTSPVAIMHPAGPYCIRHCDIETNNMTPITVCLDCTVEMPEDIVINPNNIQPPPVYYVCDTCPAPVGLPEPFELQPYYPWNPVQLACTAPGAKIPVIVTLNKWGSGNGAPVYTPDTELHISLSYMGPNLPPLTLLHSGVVGKAKYGDLDWQPCPGGEPGCIQDTIWMVIPKDIEQTGTNPPVGGWYMRITAIHPNINNALDNVPGYTALYPNACQPTGLVDTLGTITTLTVGRPDYKPDMILYDVVANCENSISLVTFIIINHKPGRQYAWFFQDHTTGQDSFLMVTPPDVNGLIVDVTPTDSVTVRARVYSPGCWGPFGERFTFYGDSLPPLDLSIDGKNKICVNDTFTYKTILYGQTYYNWRLKQERGVIIDTTSNAVTIVWDTPGIDTLIVSALRVQTQRCALADSSFDSDTLIVHIYPYPEFKPLNDTAICPGAGPLEFLAELKVDTILHRYRWFSGTDTLSQDSIISGLSPTQTTKYQVYAENFVGCRTYDSLTVTVHPDFTIDAGADRLICYGDSTQINAVVNLADLLISWSPTTGLSASTVPDPIASPQDSTIYTLRVTDAFGCEKTDEIAINVFKLKYQKDTLAHCLFDEAITLPPTQHNAVWQSSVPFNAQTREVKLKDINPGGDGSVKTALFTYTVNDCTDSLFVTVADVPKAQFVTDPIIPTTILQIPDNATLTFGNTTLNASPQLYLWDFGDSVTTKDINPTHTYTSEGQYTIWLYAENDFGCRDSVSAQVTVVESAMWIPNVFTPNSDGSNDEFSPIARGVTEFSMKIYDRWGVEVYQTNNVSQRWNGKNQNDGSLCADGVYYYVVVGKFKNGISFDRTGHVTLIR